MKGSAPTKSEHEFWSRLAGLGCIACLKDGRFNDYVSIHHIDGRTKKGAHMKVLPLCAQHHQQDDTDPLKRVSVHGKKYEFEREYGTQAELLAEVLLMVGQ